jgi:hypothetical protein
MSISMALNANSLVKLSGSTMCEMESRRSILVCLEGRYLIFSRQSVR